MGPLLRAGAPSKMAGPRRSWGSRAIYLRLFRHRPDGPLPSEGVLPQKRPRDPHGPASEGGCPQKRGWARPCDDTPKGASRRERATPGPVPFPACETPILVEEREKKCKKRLYARAPVTDTQTARCEVGPGSAHAQQRSSMSTRFFM